MEASREMIDLVSDLLDERSLREKFHNNPKEVMDAEPITDPNERAILFTMDRDLIGAATKLEAKIDAYQMESGWLEQGTDWNPNDLNDAEPPDGSDWMLSTVSQLGGDLGTPADQAGIATRGGWSDPKPHGRGFRPSKASASATGSDKLQLTLVGEGYLATAAVFIVDKKTGGDDFKEEVAVKEIDFKNFRRVYIRTHEFSIADWNPGKYKVLVRNFDSPEIRPIRAGHYFKVEA